MRKLLIPLLLMSVYGCHNGDQFLVKQPPPPDAVVASPKDSLPPALPMPTAMPFPLPTAETSEKQCWKDHDLKVLKGCWTLGETRQRTYYVDSTPHICTLSAVAVCFDEQGQSVSTHLHYLFDNTDHDCQPPMKASFADNGHVIIQGTQEVMCSNNLNDNVLDSYDCSYNSSGLADCIYHIAIGHPDEGMQVYLKRAPTSATIICKPRHPKSK